MPIRTFKIARVSPAELRAEGVIAIGRARDTSVLYVRTHVKVHLFHAEALVDRQIDAWGLEQAAGLVDLGFSIYEVARGLGVYERSLRTDLARAGWVQQSRQVPGPRRGADERFAARARRPRFGQGAPASAASPTSLAQTTASGDVTHDSAALPPAGVNAHGPLRDAHTSGELPSQPSEAHVGNGLHVLLHEAREHEARATTKAKARVRIQGSTHDAGGSFL